MASNLQDFDTAIFQAFRIPRNLEFWILGILNLEFLKCCNRNDFLKGILTSWKREAWSFETLQSSRLEPSSLNLQALEISRLQDFKIQKTIELVGFEFLKAWAFDRSARYWPDLPTRNLGFSFAGRLLGPLCWKPHSSSQSNFQFRHRGHPPI